jgi:hypothetical protein
MNPVNSFLSAVDIFFRLYQWLVKGHLRNRSEEIARNARTASVIRGGSVELRWYEWPAARALQREGHGTIRGNRYETWVNVTPTGILMAIGMRGRFEG